MDQNNNNSKNFLSNLPEILVKILPIVIAVLLILAAAAFIYWLIVGLVFLIRGSAFTNFMQALASGVSACAGHVVSATILAVLKKILEK